MSMKILILTEMMKKRPNRELEMKLKRSLNSTIIWLSINSCSSRIASLPKDWCLYKNCLIEMVYMSN
jgi:hypothetical protein